MTTSPLRHASLGPWSDTIRKRIALGMVEAGTRNPRGDLRLGILIAVTVPGILAAAVLAFTIMVLGWPP